MTSADPQSLTLRSRNNQIVKIKDARDRAFVKQADELIVKINKLLEDKKSR